MQRVSPASFREAASRFATGVAVLMHWTSTAMSAA